MEKEKISIEGLFFNDFNKIFSDIHKEILKKIDLKDLNNSGKLPDMVNKAFSEFEEHISTLYLDTHKFKIDNFLSDTSNNQKEIVKQHEESFISFLLYINASIIVYHKITDTLKSLLYPEQEGNKDLSYTQRLTISLYGLCIRRSKQIVELLISGFIDGAMIIWRSLYENAVTLLTLAVNDNDELSERFIDHSFRNSNRKVKGYHANYSELKFKPLPEKTLEYLKVEKERLIEKYGIEFTKNDYGWADILFKGKTKANFRLLEEEIGLQRYRPYYTLCSEHIHSSINGLDKFKENNIVILPRILEKDIDLMSFIDPMQFTLAILDEVNEYVLWEFSTQEELNANILFMRKIFKKLVLSFDKS